MRPLNLQILFDRLWVRLECILRGLIANFLLQFNQIPFMTQICKKSANNKTWDFENLFQEIIFFSAYKWTVRLNIQ